MVSQYLTLVYLYARKIIEHSKLWPHFLVIIGFIYLFLFTEKENITDSLLTYSELVGYAVTVLMILFTIQHCHDESESKWLIKFRSMPISYLGDFFAALSAFALYAMTILGVLFFLMLALIKGKNIDLEKERLKHYEKVSVNIKKEGEFYTIKFDKELEKGESYAMKSFLINDKNQVSRLSAKEFEISYGDNFSKNIKVIVKSKRITEIGELNGSLRILRRVNSFEGIQRIHFQEFYILNRDKSFQLAYLNSILHLVLQICLAIMFTLVLGRKFSLEVVIFCILGVFSMQYLIQILGADIIDEFIQRMERYEHDVRNFNSLWWEDFMMKWASYLAKLEKTIATNYSKSGLMLMKEGMWIGSPFSLASFQSYVFIFLIMIGLIPIMIRRDL